jgi:hypothetical protein
VCALVGFAFNIALWWEDKQNNHGILNAKNPTEKLTILSRHSRPKSEGQEDVETSLVKFDIDSCLSQK